MIWWQWVVLGALLLGAETVVDTGFYLVFIGAAAVAMGGVGLLPIEISLSAQFHLGKEYRELLKTPGLPSRFGAVDAPFGGKRGRGATRSNIPAMPSASAPASCKFLLMYRKTHNKEPFFRHSGYRPISEQNP